MKFKLKLISVARNEAGGAELALDLGICSRPAFEGVHTTKLTRRDASIC